jgi:iron complex transport system permease protein
LLPDFNALNKGYQRGGFGLSLKKKLILIFLLPLVLFIVSLFLGRYSVSLIDTFNALISKVIPITPTWPDAVETVIFQVRLPRIIVAMLVGAGLSISGASFQGMFRNPLVSPDILGVSAAAGFGACLAMLFSENQAVLQTSALLFGILGVFLTYLISRVYKTTPVLMLVLSGVVVGAFFSALIAATKYVADPLYKLPAITFWLMGGISTSSLREILFILPSMLVGIIGLLLISWRINILAMGDEEARSLGIRTEFLKGAIIVCATLITAAAVSVSGIIGWIGLVIPHVTRMIVGPDHRILLPASLALGATFLLLIDDIARTATASEIPLGIISGLIGAPFFAYLLRKTKGGWK